MSGSRVLLILFFVFVILGIVLVISGFNSFSTSLSPSPTPTNTPEVTTSPVEDNLPKVKVTKVIDGDTIEIEGGERVRYIGVDTPETVDPRRGVQCYGAQASDENKKLVEGKIVRLEKDVSETDKFGRLLRYVWVDNLLINDYLVENGFAHSSSYPPDIKYQSMFAESEAAARQKRLGLWAACP
jgi:micrococcal nuclease